MMSGLLAMFVSVLLLSVPLISVMAHEGEEVGSVEEITEIILAEQGVTSFDKIDCSGVSDGRFEQLGDAIMEKMIGSHELHEQMDEMMGGEGSESLRQMHLAMGRNWLGCSVGFQGMMSGGMMPMMMRMMGNYYPAYYYDYNGIVTAGVAGWVLFGILLVILVLIWNGNIRLKKH